MLGFTGMQAWHDYPIVKDIVCAKCRSGPVHVMLTTGLLLYLQCEACGHHWTDSERRKTPPAPRDAS